MEEELEDEVDRLDLEVYEDLKLHLLGGIREAALAVTAMNHAGSGVDALQFSQAALNLTNALAGLKASQKY